MNTTTKATHTPGLLEACDGAAGRLSAALSQENLESRRWQVERAMNELREAIGNQSQVCCPSARIYSNPLRVVCDHHGSQTINQ